MLKPLFSFAGLGVIINLTARIWRPSLKKSGRNTFCRSACVSSRWWKRHLEATKAEVRVMYIWLDELTPVMTIIRMGRGLMMGVDHNEIWSGWIVVGVLY